MRTEIRKSFVTNYGFKSSAISVVADCLLPMRTMRHVNATQQDVMRDPILHILAFTFAHHGWVYNRDLYETCTRFTRRLVSCEPHNSITAHIVPSVVLKGLAGHLPAR